MKALLVLCICAASLWGCSNNASGPPAVHSSAEYDQLLAEAAKLSAPGLHHMEEGTTMSVEETTNLKKAKDIFIGLSDARPTNFANYMAIGKIDRALGDKEGALRNYQQAIQFRPMKVNNEDKVALAECSAELARSLYEEEQLEGALGYINDAISDAPENPDYYAIQAHILIQQKDVEGATKAIEHALKLDPHHEEATALKRLIAQAEADRKQPESPHPPTQVP